jgi:CRISPR/Cas system-associated protein endoribonuclease Cas2
MSSDLKSYWLLAGLRFKFALDEFCPYCKCHKDQIEAMMRKTYRARKRTGKLGPLLIDADLYCYCFLHAKMRLTETIIRHQFRIYYSISTNKENAKREFENVLKKLTGNSALKIAVPKPNGSKDDERKFGDVSGFTGGMVDGVLRGSDELAVFAARDRKEDVKELWATWREVVRFIEKESKVTEAFRNSLEKLGKSLLDTFEWKVLTAYAHIVVEHSAEMIEKWGNLALLSQQGLEAANKVHKTIAKRATNHTKKKSVQQQFYHVYRRILLNENNKNKTITNNNNTNNNNTNNNNTNRK